MSKAEESTSQALFIEALDGVQLEATLFEPSSDAHTVLLINSGTGIPRRFYSRFAEHATGRGFAVLTFDYRGVGGSAPKSLKESEARYRDWGQRDVPGAIKWLRARYPSSPISVIGHSTGGQQLGLAENIEEIQAAVFIGVSTGYWGGMNLRMKLLSFFLWKIYVPLTGRVLGYAPAKLVGLGENLPVGVAREWGSWCLEPEYLAAFFDEDGRRSSLDGNAFGATHFDRASFPIRAYCFTDDPIATPANVPPLLGLYRSAKVEDHWISPGDLGLRQIGHLGFFHAEIGKVIWDEPLDWLRAQAKVK